MIALLPTICNKNTLGGKAFLRKYEEKLEKEA
jgi:hypothetical protein